MTQIINNIVYAFKQKSKQFCLYFQAYEKSSSATGRTFSIGSRCCARVIAIVRRSGAMRPLIHQNRSDIVHMIWIWTWRAVMVASERIVVMVSELVRRSVRGFQPPQEETELEALLLRANASTKEANEALDDALRFVQESNCRIDAMPGG
jgi:hypothetical protein